MGPNRAQGTPSANSSSLSTGGQASSRASPATARADNAEKRAKALEDRVNAAERKASSSREARSPRRSAPRPRRGRGGGRDKCASLEATDALRAGGARPGGAHGRARRHGGARRATHLTCSIPWGITRSSGAANSVLIKRSSWRRPPTRAPRRGREPRGPRRLGAAVVHVTGDAR